LEAAVTTRKTPTTEFISLQTALEHVAAHERAPKPALTRALAGKVRSRGFVRYHWPPYHEGLELCSFELFSDYGPQHPLAKVNWVEGTATLAEGHVHPPCAVYGLEVHRADLLARWPGPLKRAASRPSNKQLLRQAEKSGGRITWPDGTQLDFSKAEQQGGNAVDQWIAKHADRTEGH
jgi:hypothetical protein